MITIKTFLDSIEANIVKGRLESEGIPALLIDENTVNTYWIYAQAIGGIRLQVQEIHVAKALAVLNENQAKMYALKNNENDNKGETCCPICSSSDIRLNKYSKSLFGFSWLLIGFPLLIPNKKYHCFNCGNDWKI